MFDISWSEFLLIGIVALVVIGPKVRGMAAEFQNQFQEAMREAEMADLKKSVDDMARDVADIDPLKGLHEDIQNVGSEMQRSLSAAAEQRAAVLDATAAEPALAAPPAAAEPNPLPAPDGDATASAPAATPAPDEPKAPTPPAEPSHADADAAPADNAARA
jgi:sec-independent protein translocase protein TatB